MHELRKHPGGRPATGRRYPHKLFSYGSDRDRELTAALAEKWEVSVAEAIRRAVREAAKREKVT